MAEDDSVESSETAGTSASNIEGSVVQSGMCACGIRMVASMMEIVQGAHGGISPWGHDDDWAQGARWARPTTTAVRLQTLHTLYERLGSLGAVGKQVGLTRERVRQLLVKGTQRGLFAYSPRKYPRVPKAQLIEEYTRIQSIGRVARLNRISENHLKKLLAEYSIAESQLARYRMEGRRARCIAEYQQMAAHAGRHLSSGDLHRHAAGVALYARIIRCWGSIRTFRRALKIPNLPKSVWRFPERSRELSPVRSVGMPPIVQRRYSGELPVEIAVG